MSSPRGFLSLWGPAIAMMAAIFSASSLPTVPRLPNDPNNYAPHFAAYLVLAICAVRGFAREHDLTYPILLGTDEVRRAYRVRSFPTNYYVSGDGSVRTSTVGLSTRLGMALRLLMTPAD